MENNMAMQRLLATAAFLPMAFGLRTELSRTMTSWFSPERLYTVYIDLNY